ncbi:DUF7824 domain-containing protein [Streptomyces sp. HUAS TT20]|uniref:DUF7824 domain-containing protein n=1 Tax=Streptomyces sp. HUAS TT20 TaxID=3447509 RepID=UPI0021DB2C3C|nr:DUF6493 family protein [Streptomyces sp. HUAS 15-9]UXY26201.1 DUF6493 family protein [Streptomyces sp. HUAS 15-9]
MSAVMKAVRAGRTAETLRLLKGMTDPERRALLPELKAVRKELRTDPWGNASRDAHPALHAAGAACHTGAAAAASWLSGSDMRWWQASPELLLQALEGRDNAWLADVAHRLAQRPVSADVPYELMSGLVHRAGCDVPVTDAYVVGWIRHIGSSWASGSILDRLRGEPDLARLVAGLFDLTDLSEVRWLFGDGPNSWQSALAELTRRGSLDRKTMVDACVSRLLRGGAPTDHRVFLPLFELLGLTREEERERTADWIALARDAASPVASHAQSVLASLALDGELSTRLLAEASEGLLFRTEKKLVRAQLVLLGKVLSRDPSAAAELLPVAAQAFGHEDTQLQERALKLVERHAKKVDSDALRDELTLAVEQLTPSLRTRAVDGLGLTGVDREPVVYEEVLPPAPEPVRLAAAPESAVELAEEVSALLAAGGDVATFERALDGLVRQAHQNLDALLEALEPVIVRRHWHTAEPGQWHHADSYFNSYNDLHGTEDALDLLLATLRGGMKTSTLHHALQNGSNSPGCLHVGLSEVFDSRLWEVAYRLRTDPLPLLLSTPTWSTGLLEPDELVDRLGTYRRLGARVAAADFAQALLRVRRADRPVATAAARRAAALGTAEGDRLARWLSKQGPAQPWSTRHTSATRIVVELGELLELQEDFPAEFQRLGRRLAAYGAHWHCSHWNEELRRHWLAALPEQRELVAARIVHDLSGAAVNDIPGPVDILPLLAESGGEAGASVHLCVAYGLGARQAEDRLAAVDALLVLAARGQLDAEGLGTDLGLLVQCGTVKPLRLAESARTAAATGANATIWEMLRHTLPVLLADPETASVRGLGDLLAVAAECAERSGARGELPHLAATAARRGSSRLVTEARRLRDALAAPAR